MSEYDRAAHGPDEWPADISGKNVTDLLSVLWAWRFVVGGLMALAFVLTAVVTLLSPVLYEASVLLLVSPSKIPALDGAQAVPLVTPEAFIGILHSRALAREVVQHFGLEKPPHHVTAEHFLSSTFTVRAVKGTNLILAAVTLRDPKLAADVVNFLAEKVVALNAQVNQADAISTQEYLRPQRDQAQRTLEKAESTLTDFLRSANLEGLRADLQVMIEEKGRIAEALASATTSQASEEARVQEYRSALRAQKQLVTLRKSVLSDPSAVAAAQDLGQSQLKGLAALEFQSEEVNSLYQDILRNLINSEAQLAALTRQRTDLEKKLAVNQQQLIKVGAEVAAVESRFDALKRAAELAATTYRLLAKKVDEASLSVIARTTELKLVDRAVPAGEPLPRRLLLKLAVGLVAGLVFSALLVLVLEHARGRPRAIVP